MNARHLRLHAAKLATEVAGDTLGRDDDRGAAALLAALAHWDAVVLRRAALGEAGDGNRGVELLRQAIEFAEDEAGDTRR